MNIKMISVCLGLLISAPGIMAAEKPGLPNPKPFAEVTELARQDPILHTSTSSWRDYRAGKNITFPKASFIVGNKEVRVCKQHSKSPYNIYVYIDNKEMGFLTFWGSFGSGKFGYPFPDIANDPAKLLVDKKNKTVTLSKPYLTKDGKKATFTYTLRSLGKSKIEVTWDVGKTEDGKPSSAKVAPWFGLKPYRENQVYFGDEFYEPTPREKLLESENNKVSSTRSGNIYFAKNKPALSYAIEFGDVKGGVEENITQSKNRPDKFGIMYRPEMKENKIIIDLQQAAQVAKNTPPPIGGIDFYKNDGTHIPKSPVRNLFFNPTFNQGLHYWCWAGGGARYDPSIVMRYAIEPKGLFNKNVMVINPFQTRSASLKSFPIALEKGKTYTVSFYAKSVAPEGQVTVALCSAAEAGKFRGKYGVLFGDSGTPESQFKVNNKWQRYSRTFTADEYGIMLLVTGNSKSKLYIDGIQLEEGSKPTEFISAPLEGVLVTTNPDNDIVKGQYIGGQFIFYGKPGVKGKVKVTVQNCYREIVDEHKFDVEIPKSGEQEFELPLNEKSIGKGVFVLRADYQVAGYEPYTDYRRLSIMTPLKNEHETKNIFGTITGYMCRICRGDDFGQKLVDWGFGSTSWGINPDHYSQTVRAGMEKKYKIANFFSTTRFQGNKNKKYAPLNNYKKWTEATPEMIKLAEESAYEKVKLYDSQQYNTWCFGNEEESHVLPNKKPDEYMKVIAAAQRGAKRADPNIKFFLTNGTSGYSLLRGFHPMEGYFKAAKKIGLRFDAVTTHPYGSLDGGRLSRNDLDEETARLIDQMDRYGYGKETPIYYTEGGNIAVLHCPEWNTANGDRFQNGMAGYDFGYKEFIHAASTARYWIISLKYWPHLQGTNIWFAKPFMDYHLTPFILNKMVNTLGHHMPYVKHYGDIKPNAKIRGYTFNLKDGSAIAALWCIDRDVEFGLTRGPRAKVKFEQDVQFYDLMGNRRYPKPDKEGIIDIPLTPAPLFIKAKNVEKLTKSLQALETDDTRSNYVVKFLPDLEGDVNADLKNMTNREQKGTIEVAQQTLKYDIKPESKVAIKVPGQSQKVEFGKMYRWNKQYSLKPEGSEAFTDDWKMDYFYVQKTDGPPNWDKIPAIKMTNRFFSRKMKEKIANGLKLPENDLSAQFKMAWDDKNLYLRVEAEDNDFVISKDFWDKQAKSETMLYHHDGCLEVYFDTGANGRLKKVYDDDDYRYDFSIGRNGKSGPGTVYRFREVDHQLADGVNMPSKKEAAEKIKCDFQITKKGYTYTITFGLRYIEPIALRKGFISGFSLYLHDKESKEQWPAKALTTSTQKGKHSDYNPHLWPLMILAD